MMLQFMILCISFFVSLVHALPLAERDVFNPHILSPSEGTVWPVGTTQTVTWRTSDIPPNLTSPQGRVLLGHLGPTGGLNLDLQHPLAQGFMLTDGHARVTVPDVPPRKDYIVVLMGDSGNASPAFSIVASDGPPSAAGLDPDPTTSTLISTPIPITGSTITGGSSGTPRDPTSTPTDTSSTTPSVPTTAPTVSPEPTPTTPTSSSTSSSTSSTGVSAAASSPTSNSAWRSRSVDSMKAFTIGMVSLCLVLVV